MAEESGGCILLIDKTQLLNGCNGLSMADAQVARVADFGRNDTIFTIRIHLGHILSPGDYALGYDLYGANNNNPELEKYKGLVLPFAVLIKKSYEEQRGKPLMNAPSETASMTDGNYLPSVPSYKLFDDLDISDGDDVMSE